MPTRKKRSSKTPPEPESTMTVGTVGPVEIDVDATAVQEAIPQELQEEYGPVPDNLAGEPANEKGRLGRVVLARGVKNFPLLGTVRNDWGNKLQLDLIRSDAATKVKYTVADNDLISVLRDDDCVPAIVSIERDRIVCLPWVDGGADGNPVPVMAARMVNKPGRVNLKHEEENIAAAEKMFDGNTLRIELENRHPAAFITITLHDVVDKTGILEWMSRPTTMTCQAPRIIEEIEDPSIRVLTDEAWHPFSIGFAGSWSCETSQR